MENLNQHKFKRGVTFQIYPVIIHENHQSLFTLPEKKTDPKIRTLYNYVSDWQIPENPPPIYA